MPLPPLSPIQGEDSGDLGLIGKYSSKVCLIDPIPDMGIDTGSSEEILDPEYGFSHILVLLCEVTDFLMALPLHSTRAQYVVEVFQRGYLAYSSPSSHMFCDLDPAFTSSLTEALLFTLAAGKLLVTLWDL